MVYIALKTPTKDAIVSTLPNRFRHGSTNIMFKLLITFFILVPIVEIAVFIQVGEQIGLSSTLFIVIITAILGVNLLKQQGFTVWRDIQLSMAQGKIPALEMASGAQLLFAGGLLLTPGFVTDSIGFILMFPQVRLFLARKFIASRNSVSFSAESYTNNHVNQSDENGRVIEGEFEEKE